jgi:hypothetical protein
MEKELVTHKLVLRHQLKRRDYEVVLKRIEMLLEEIERQMNGRNRPKDGW